MDGVDRMIFEPLESDTDDFDTAVYTTSARFQRQQRGGETAARGGADHGRGRCLDHRHGLLGIPSFSSLSRTYPGGRRYRSWWPCSMPPEQYPDPRPGGFHFRRVLTHWPAHGPPGHRRCPTHAALGLAVVEKWRKF
jgi:hypothetical protein